ncbi:TRAP transporter large permease [Thalassospira marina]|uniref:TRAP transporter large permease protein n=1 Tax=Thalassospira marina TaxID=2048283 RepID=A0A2N3KT10_9PROT|nr:TRAP transporter large permease [Thalassospira marina]AUG51285.1 ABC transporter permease [Thalassospira marina]PKR53657.1 ABC transporter permease [Thalassospira marina]
MLSLFVLLALVGLIVFGVPIAVALAVTAVGTYLALGETSILTMLPQRMYSATTSFTLLAIPFFILAGNLMNTGGVTERIFRFAAALVGHIRGGLGQVNVFASLIFSGMSGAAVADAAGLGQVEFKSMRDRGYDERFSAAITAASSTIGPVFPPSIPFVIFASLTGTSVVRLFLAGVVPGVLMAIALMVAVYVVALIRKFPREMRASYREIWQSFKGAFLPLGTPFIIIAGILSGLFTPTEAGVTASFYAAFLGLFVYREITVQDLPRILWDTLLHTVRVLFVIAAAGFFGWLLIHQRVPNTVINLLLSLSDSPAVIMSIIVLVLLVLGMFLEGIAVLVITVPIFMPIMQTLGVDPIQFGVIMIMCSMVGLLTPPVGMVLFAVSSVTNVAIAPLVKELWPYLIGIMVVLLLVVCVPAVSTWLPSLVMGGGQ